MRQVGLKCSTPLGWRQLHALVKNHEVGLLDLAAAADLRPCSARDDQEKRQREPVADMECSPIGLLTVGT
jgi:hypothetical protein